MTAETDLLPLYAELQGHPKLEIVKHYARANIAHATAARDAEVEALRAEVADVRASAVDIEKEAREAWKQATHWRRKASRAERLAEALREARPFVAYAYDQGIVGAEDAGRHLDAALNPTAAQENDDA